MVSAEHWSQIKELLRKELNEQAYSVWIAPTGLASSDETSLTVAVPNKFFKEWLEDHYAGSLNTVIKHILGREMLLKFKISVDADRTGQAESKNTVIEKDIKTVLTNLEEESRALKLDGLGLNPKNTFDNFVVGPGNRFAHAACVAVSESPAKSYNPLFIYGGVGLGKTHLMQAVAHYIATNHQHMKILYIPSERFTTQLISAIQTRTTNKFRQMYRTVDLLLIDDIHFIAGKEATQEEFFHTFNTLYDDHKQIVISSDRPPKDIPGLEERLVSRFGWGLVTDIQAPDFETRSAILRKKAERETVKVPDEVTSFIAEKIRTNIRELEGALIRVVAYSKLIGKEVDLPLAKEILKDMVSEEKKITIDLIQKRVAEFFDIKLSDMKSKKRSRAIAYPRQVAMHLSRELTSLSLPEIGNYFGGRDHTTIMHACNKIRGEAHKKDEIRKILDRLTSDIKRG